MSYEKYTTDALVLSAYDRGEHDKVFTLYTRDFGLVYARASAVRKLESRMRSALSLLTPTTVSLVRGARGWRVTGAQAQIFTVLSPEGAHTFARISKLTRRLVRGEEQHRYLFEVLSGARSACASMEGVSLSTVELLCVSRVLYALGYLSPSALTSALFMHAQYTDDTLKIIEQTQGDVLVSINSAIAESQL